MWRCGRPALQWLTELSRCHALHTTSPSALMELSDVTRVLKEVAPLQAAESWDNVGLLVEPSRQPLVKTLLITNDFTEQVLEEALEDPERKPQLIVSYHPPLFKAFKRLTQHSTKERLVVRVIEEGIAVYSPHTSLDNMEGGINDWLLSGVGEGKVTALGLNKSSVQFSNVVEMSGPQDQRDAVEKEVLGLQVGGHSDVKSSPSVLRVECTDVALARLLPIVRKQFPSISIASFSNSKVLATPSGGKMLRLTQASPFLEIVKRVKSHLQLQHVRVAQPHHHKDAGLIRTVAACAGSGGSVLEDVEADLLLSGEMSHHQVLAATARGCAVILCEHSNTERGFLQGRYKQWLQEALEGKVQVTVSYTDRDPLHTL